MDEQPESNSLETGDTAASGLTLPVRTRDAERTKRDILAVAIEEFANHGLSGARVSAIAERIQTTKAMVYYYFGSKAGLYEAVLERAYADIRQAEAQLDLARLDPETAIRRLVDFTFDYDDANPAFVRLIANENMLRGVHLARSPNIEKLNLVVIETLSAILARGRRDGVFREAADAVDVHLLISSLCFCRVSNQHTFGAIFRCDLSDPEIRARHRRMIGDAVVRYLLG